MNDQELVAAVLGGRPEAFQALYDRYVRRIYGLVQRMVGPQDAEEVAQEAFLQVYRNLGRFRGESQLYTWLYRVAANTALQHLRKTNRVKNRTASFDELSENAPGALVEAKDLGLRDPGKAAEDSELRRQIEQVMETLPPNQKLVLTLGPIKGMSYEQMAQVLEVTVPIVKARLHRARENLRARLKELRRESEPPAPPGRSAGNGAARGEGKGPSPGGEDAPGPVRKAGAAGSDPPGDEPPALVGT